MNLEEQETCFSDKNQGADQRDRQDLSTKQYDSQPLNTERYDRQMLLSEVGAKGQRLLRKAKVLVVGAGGLGCPALMYLAGAGVGTLGIADADEVSVANLPRQVLHPASNVGKNKAESAKEALLRMNEEVAVKAYPFFLTSENIAGIIEDYDFVIDATDNFETKYLINDTCVAAGKPFCYGGVIQFHGQVLTYVPGKGPCIRCIFGDVPEPGSIPNCSQVGVMGPACGVIGSVQALEAVKYIVGAGDLLTGKMFIFDGLTMKSRIAEFPNASPECICQRGTGKKASGLLRY